MARRRASMREGPLAELFKATEAAQRQAEREQRRPGNAPTLRRSSTPRLEQSAPDRASRRGRA